MSLRSIESLKKRLSRLVEDYDRISNELSMSVDVYMKIQYERRLATIETEMNDLETRITTLTNASAHATIETETNNAKKILANLNALFNFSELRSLVYDLDIKYDDLHGATISEKCIALVKYCERHNLLGLIESKIKRLRPHAKW